MNIFLYTHFLFFNQSDSIAQNSFFNVMDYGGVGDGKTICTKALQSAVDACDKNGGGEVFIPTGVFMIGTVHLKSNIHLYFTSRRDIKGQ